MPIAYCPLPIAYCLLPTPYSLLPIAYSLLPTPYSRVPHVPILGRGIATASIPRLSSSATEAQRTKSKDLRSPFLHPIGYCLLLFPAFREMGCPILKLGAQQRALGWDRTTAQSQHLRHIERGLAAHAATEGAVAFRPLNTAHYFSLSPRATEAQRRESKDLRLLFVRPTG